MPAARGVPVLVLSLILAACDSAPAPSASAGAPRPTTPAATQPTDSAAPTDPGTPPPTTEPTDAPEPSQGAGSGAVWATDPPTPILVNSIVRVTADELELREEPFLAATSTAVLARDATLFVEPAPPVDSDGSIWYRGIVVSTTGEVPALPGNVVDTDTDFTFGWFPADTGDTRSVSRVAPRCPEVINLRYLAAMTSSERLACFGTDWIEVEGTFRCFETCLAHAFGEFEPEWLAHPANLNLVFAGTTDDYGLNLRFPPTIAEPEIGTKIRVRGHLRDAAAETCTMSSNYWWPPDNQSFHPYPAAVATLLCRQEFVVETWEDIG